MSKLPKEAVKFAKSMGLDLNGLEPEAEDIWKMLDDMSSRDPIQYEEFVRQQFESAKDVADKKEPAEAEKRSFRPSAGYCVETNTLGGDGLKIRDVGASSGKKMYINLCSSVVIEEPTDKLGKPIVGTRNVADGLSIPLIVGPVRGQEATSNENSKELYVDVVLHPRVIELANSEKYFKAQIVDLALDWVIKESKVECNRTWTHVTSATYKGGRGENRDTPVLFFVDANGAPVPVNHVDGSTNAGAGATPKSSVLSSTSSLLSQLSKEKTLESTQVADNFDILNSKPIAKAVNKPVEVKPAKPLIQEIGTSSNNLKTQEDITLRESTSRSLQSSGKVSTAAAPAPTTSQVQATTSSSPLLSTAAPLAASATSTAPTATKVTAASSVPVEREAKGPGHKEPSKREYQGMEELLRGFDDEFSNVVGGPDDQTFLDTVSANDMIANLAKVLAGGSSGVPAIPSSEPVATPLRTSGAISAAASAAAAATTSTGVSRSGNGSASGKVGAEKASVARSSIESCVQVTNDAPAAVTMTLQDSDPSGPERYLTLTVSGLSSSMDTATMELLVSPREVLVKIDTQYIPGYAIAANKSAASDAAAAAASFGAKVSGGAYLLLESTAAASFKKKKGTLIVKIHYIVVS